MAKFPVNQGIGQICMQKMEEFHKTGAVCGREVGNSAFTGHKNADFGPAS